MFLAEAKLAARLNHPNLVQLFDFGEAEGSYFIAMEYIDGPTLRLLLARARDLRAPISLGLAARIVSSAAEGLAYAHDFRDQVTDEPLHLVHRDVSPDNILIGRSGAVKLVDFGIAKARGQSHHTQAGTVKGKVAYMAPEQLRGEPLDRRVDLYALGVVLYELCTGCMPFEAGTDASMVRAVLYDAPIPAVSRVPTLPPAIQSILDRLLAKDRNGRYRDCRTLHADLEAFIPSTREATSGFALSRLVAQLAPPPRLPSPRRRAPRRCPRGDGLRVRADLEQPHPSQRAVAGPGRGRGRRPWRSSRATARCGRSRDAPSAVAGLEVRHVAPPARGSSRPRSCSRPRWRRNGPR
jgi:serine/threonine-protein kinase